jgi:hypothetical protein
MIEGTTGTSYAVGALDHFLQQQSGSAGRRVDDELLRVRRHEHLEAAQAAVFFRRAVRGVDHRRIRRARAQPRQAGSLRVVVHQRGRDVLGREAGGEVYLRWWSCQNPPWG